MGKKNIKPNLNQPVIRTHVAKPALLGLSEENLTTAAAPNVGLAPLIEIPGVDPWDLAGVCSYDGDDAE
ncbi:MAG: microcyclamide/patellamide family RiPP [Okeania sp. SIO3I5]|uniref:microcyclamide/patellamide family RiPP n=1 Tax=Okeania sp. SIO3I5 TaxID=2607805 RepID=UPI0013BA731A|nr:microcyclamide/patellamide family RiPP [Okeania sp. SIO3I5]NEQ40158.1 microcyclamide/patellamide family RiPP [Okeania sp. SIO3I5]